MFHIKYPVGSFLVFTVVVGMAILPAAADTVTWTGHGDGESWSDGDNWSGGQEPGSDDDVIHDNADIILMDVGTPANPEIIKSLTVDGEAGGGLVVQQGKGLRIKGDFENTNTDEAYGYEQTMKPNSLVWITGELVFAAHDLVRVNVSIEPVTSGSPTELIVTGAIVGGDFEVNTNGIVTVGTSSGPDRSELWGTWRLDAAQATFAKAQGIVETPLRLTLANGAACLFSPGPTVALSMSGFLCASVPLWFTNHS